MAVVIGQRIRFPIGTRKAGARVRRNRARVTRSRDFQGELVSFRKKRKESPGA